MAFTPDRLAAFVPRLQSATRCYVGYSGGLDSHVLLVSLVRLMGKEAITAIHVNHRLSPHADDWQQHCEWVCRSLGVELLVEPVDVELSGQGPEDAARQARYAVFEQYMGPGCLLILAHHADDQAETVLYRLLRGSGPLGLAGIPAARALGEGELLRPLLTFTRRELEDYAVGEGLSWVEDESNAELTFDRNFIRHRVLPAITERWPDYAARIGLSASLCLDNEQLAAVLAEQDLLGVYEREERLGWSVSLEAVSHLDPLRQGNLLRHWAVQHQLPRPGRQVIETFQRELLPAREDASPEIHWSGVHLRRYQRRLYLLPPDAEGGTAADSLAWVPRTPLVLPDNSCLKATLEKGAGLLIPRGASVEVRFRQGGERCRPQGRSGSNTLKVLFQEYGLEPWLRQRVPLIFVDGELAAVADLWICEGFAAGEGQCGAVIQWSMSGNSD